jgi:hypothetical protein
MVLWRHRPALDRSRWRDCHTLPDDGSAPSRTPPGGWIPVCRIKSLRRSFGRATSRSLPSAIFNSNCHAILKSRMSDLEPGRALAGNFFLLTNPHLLFCQPFHGFPREAPTMLTLNSIIQRDPEVISSEADRDLIMVSIATGSYYGLSDVAREIWDAIERPKKISDLVDDLAASYDVDASLCEEQTLSFLKALLDEGLLHVKEGSAG